MTGWERETIINNAGLLCQLVSKDDERFGEYLSCFIIDHANWSRATFGPDGNPMGALKHLRKEIDEVLEAPTDPTEYADCFILLLDAIRRAGFDFTYILSVAIEKQKINEKREWPKPIPGEPCEHIRSSDGT